MDLSRLVGGTVLGVMTGPKDSDRVEAILITFVKDGVAQSLRIDVECTPGWALGVLKPKFID